MKEILLFFLENAVVFQQEGNQEILLPVDKGIGLLILFEKYEVLILGGDLYEKKYKSYDFLYDMWAYQENDCKKSIVEARAYLEAAKRFYQEKDIFVSIEIDL